MAMIHALRSPLVALALLTSAVQPIAAAADLPPPVPLRDTFPAGSIDSEDLADRALTAVQARRQLMESDYLVRQRDCYKQFFANDCIDKLNAERRAQEVDFNSVKLEADRYKRNANYQHMREQQEQKKADAAANAQKDAAQRQQNRQGYEQKQADAAQKATDKTTRAKQDSGNAAAYSSKLSTKAQSEAGRSQRDQTAQSKSEKEEADQKQKEADAEDRRQSLARRKADKAADRAKRAADAKAHGNPAPPGTLPEPGPGATPASAASSIGPSLLTPAKPVAPAATPATSSSAAQSSAKS